MQKFWCLVASLILVSNCENVENGAETDYSIQETANKLRTFLFQNYSDLIRPKLNQSEPLTVKFDIALKQVLDVNVKTQKMTLFLWQRQTWVDEFLSWDPDKFGNLSQIFVSPMDIWIPDIIFQNSLDEMEEVKDRSIIKVMLLSSGQVIFFRPVLKSTTCQMSVRYFPYDSQVCAFQVGSWMLPTSQLDISLLYFETSLSGFVEHHEWELADRFAERRSSTVYVNLTDTLYQEMNFPYLEFSFLFERKPEFFEKNLIVPTALISVLSEMTFLLPSQSGEKVGFSVTVFLSLCVNLLVIASHVPASSESFPIIGQYYLTCIFLIALSIAQTTLILTVHFTGEQFFVKPVPHTLQTIFFKYIGPMVGYRKPNFQRAKTNHFSSTVNGSSILSRKFASSKAKKQNSVTFGDLNAATFAEATRYLNNGSQKDGIFASLDEFSAGVSNPLFGDSANFEPRNATAPTDNFPSGQNLRWCKTADDKLKSINESLQVVVDYLHQFHNLNEAKVARFRMMEDWKLLSKIIDRLSAIIYGIMTTSFTIYFLSAPRFHSVHELNKYRSEYLQETPNFFNETSEN